MMRIVHSPNQVLSQKAKPVVFKNGLPDKATITLIEEMKKTLSATRDPEGIGLAAPQVGKSLQLFIMQPTPSSKVGVYINPVITFESEISTEKRTKKKKGSVKLEGCLSLPNIWGYVRRYPSLHISYFDEKGKQHEKDIKGFNATIIQHEVDHLKGILFPKHVLQQNETLFKSHKNEKGEDVFEEIEL